MSAPDRGWWLRVVGVVLGVWLIFSAFIWPHTGAQQVNTIIVGVLAIGIAAMAALSRAKMRYLNVGVAIWLLISTFALPTSSLATWWNAIFVAFLLVAASIVPWEPERLEAPLARPAH